MVKIAVLVSGGGTNLQALIDAKREGRIPAGELCLVLSSSPDAYALERAKEAGIPTAVVARKEYETREGFTDALLASLADAKAELVVFAGFLYILSPAFAKAYAGRSMNVHPALIPAFSGDGYYGLRVHEAALEYGVRFTGATVHFVDEVCDGGPIILQKPVPVLPNDTPSSLQRRVMEEAEWDILPRAVSLYCEGRLKVEGRRVRVL